MVVCWLPWRIFRQPFTDHSCKVGLRQSTPLLEEPAQRRLGQMKQFVIFIIQGCGLKRHSTSGRSELVAGAQHLVIEPVPSFLALIRTRLGERLAQLFDLGIPGADVFLELRPLVEMDALGIRRVAEGLGALGR